MNATQQAHNAYGANAHPVRTPRGTEYDAFARITSRLKSAGGRQGTDMRVLAAAVHDNRRLWALLAADAAADGNRLPGPLRAQIISIAEFTRRHSALVLRRQASVAPLLEVNTAIMRGLRDAQGGGETQVV
ncbi:flagellar biosynthesis regulator FlaF [Roseovarius salis]|uniref:flagellar biosynthesis regulator FlaF n=1 Tax=Roseovarius salis TaxID=3376063 RepID=UPI0037C93730